MSCCFLPPALRLPQFAAGCPSALPEYSPLLADFFFFGKKSLSYLVDLKLF
jgi:hypothetical protein